MKTQKTTGSLLTTLLIFSIVLSVSSCQSSLKEKASKHYNNLRMDKALNSFKKLVVQSNFSPKDKADFYFKISKIFHKAYHLNDSAAFYAEKGMSIADNSQKKQFLKQLAIYYLESNDFDRAGDYGSLLLKQAQKNKDSLEAIDMLLNIKISDIERNASKHELIQANKLDSAIHLSNMIYRHRPELPANNENRLELFLIKGLGSEALSALKDYFFFDDDTLISNFYQKRMDVCQQLMNDSILNHLTEENKIKIIQILGEFRFYNVALVLSKYYGIENAAELEETLAYANFKKAFESAVITHYSDILINKDNDRNFKKQLDSCHRYLWSKIKACSGKPYDYDSLVQIAGRTFGMNSFLKEKGSYHVYILGEAIYQTTKDVEQYGHQAPFYYYLVEHISGTNVRGYYYDYFEWGGWSEKGLVMENRKKTLEGAIGQWEKLSQKTTAQIDTIIRQLAGHDDSLLVNKEIADLPGLRTRLWYKGISYMRDSIQKAGYNGAELRKKVIGQIRFNDYLSNTLAHEGRHVIDGKLHIAGSDHVITEFNANLSSIIFGPIPQISLSRVLIYDPDSKDETGHGKANTKIVQGFALWMKTHKTEIQGFDASRPVLSQADKLSNAQIITICRGMDPLCRN